MIKDLKIALETIDKAIKANNKLNEEKENALLKEKIRVLEKMVGVQAEYLKVLNDRDKLFDVNKLLDD